MVQLEIFLLKTLAKIFLRLERISNRLKLTSLSKVFKWIIKKIDINIYDNVDFLLYVASKNAGLKRDFQNIETIALRGSTADYGFYPDYFPNSYNLGLISSDLHFTYLQYKTILKNGENIKNIILFASLSMIGFSLSKTLEKNRLIAYHTAFDIPIPESYSFKQRYIRYIDKKLTNIKTQPTDKEYKDYEFKTSFMSNTSDMNRRIVTHTRENKRMPNQLNWLEKLDIETLKNNHNLFIVLPPFRSDYKEKMPSFNEGYKKLLSINFQNSEILNFHDSDIFNDSDFGDLDHLNEIGAKKLTKELFSLVQQ